MGVMKKILILIFITITSFVVIPSNIDNNKTIFFVNKYKQLPADELLRIADIFSANNINDSALMCYSIVYNSYVNDKDTTNQRILYNALNRAGLIYLDACSYNSAFDLLLRSLNVAKTIGDTGLIGQTYVNIGNVYYFLKDYELAKKYYRLAVREQGGNYHLCAGWSNLGSVLCEENMIDSALYFYSLVRQVKNKYSDSTLYSYLNNMGYIHQKNKEYDSAEYYYRYSLRNVNSFGDGSCGNSEEHLAKYLSNMAALNLDKKRLDTAEYYLIRSTNIAKRFNLNKILLDNYKYYSQLEEAKGNFKSSLMYYKQYKLIEDSIFNINQYSKINKLQFIDDMSKIDVQIKELNIEREANRRTIGIQKKLQLISILILLVVIAFFVMLYFKNKTLNSAYNKLVEKSLERDKYDRLSEGLQRFDNKLIDESELINDLKYYSSNLKDDAKSNLTYHILSVMSDSKIFCNPDFSLDTLSEIVGSNTTYVSQIINEKFDKNFRCFLNEYRIKEACKMLSNNDNRKYTIEAIATLVGFKSKGSFNPIFKEIIGVTPSFYIKSLKKQR